MAARKWLFRSLFPVLLVLGIGVGLWIHGYLNPTYVRQQLLSHLEREFPEYRFEIGSAYLRLFGGISVWDLKMIPRDDPKGVPVIVIPQALLVHDKESFQNGKLILRRVELTGLQVRLERDLAGVLNLASLMHSAGSGEKPAALIAKKTSLSYTDLRLSPTPILKLHEFDATILNDPSTVYSVDLQLPDSPAGRVRLAGRWDTDSGDRFAQIDFDSISFSDDFRRMAMIVSPEIGKQILALQGSATAQLKLSYQPETDSPWKHDLKFDLNDCQFTHPDLPIELSKLNVKGRCNDGHLLIERAMAQSGPATIILSLDLPIKPANIENTQPGNLIPLLSDRERGKDHPLLLQTMFEHLQPQRLTGASKELGSGGATTDPEWLRTLESRMRRLDVEIQHLPLTRELFARLPAKLQSIQKLFQPEGAISLQVEFRREGTQWTKRCLVRPERFTARYEDYPYPVTKITGSLDQSFGPNSPDELKIDLVGIAAGRPVTIRGHVRGEDPTLDMELKILCQGMPLDDAELIDSLPQPYPRLVRQMHLTGRGDLQISVRQNEEVRRLYGPDEFDNEFFLSVIDGRFNYERFPYPLEKVQGTVYLRTQPLHPTQLPPSPGVPPSQQKAWGGIEYLELRDFSAQHGSARLKFSGKKQPTTGGSSLNMKIEARNLEFDTALYEAMARLKLSDVATVFRPQGRMNCVLQAKLFQRGDLLQAQMAKFDPAEDLEVNFAFAGASIQPTFFPVLLNEVMGQLSYNKSRVELFDFTARRGDAQVSIAKSEILLRPNGGHWSDVRDLSVTPLVLDAELLAALSPGLRQAIQSLELKGGMSLHATRLVIDDPHESRPRNLPAPEPVPTFVRGYRPEGNSEVPIYGMNANSSANPNVARPTIYWDGKIVLNKASLVAGVPCENLSGCFATRGLFENGQLGRVLANLSLDQSRIARQPVQEVVARFEMSPQEPNVVKVPMIRGSLYGGEVGGEARLVLQEPFRFDLKLNATRIKLEEVARSQRISQNTQLEGLATAQVYLQNAPDEKTGKPILQGGGSIDVPSGKLLNLPHILDLLKVVKGKPPDETFFDEAKILFRIRGNRVVIGQLDLMGNAISLGGEGEVNLDGSNMNLEFYTVWTRVNNLLTPALNDVTALFSKAFFKVTVKGELGGKTEVKKEAVPVLIDPLRRVLERMRVR